MIGFLDISIFKDPIRFRLNSRLGRTKSVQYANASSCHKLNFQSVASLTIFVPAIISNDYFFRTNLHNQKEQKCFYIVKTFENNGPHKILFVAISRIGYRIKV